MSSFGGIVIHRSAQGDDEFHVVDHRDLRSLYFDDGSIQSRIRRSNPAQLVLEYTRAMLLPLLLIRPRRVLLMGLGGGALVNYLIQHTACEVEVVDRNATVIDLAQRYFLLPAEGRVTIHHADADQFLRQSHALYDLILVDLYSAHGPAPVLLKKGFYQRCDKHLAPEGMLSVNLWLPPEDDALPDALRLLERTLQRPAIPITLHEDYDNLVALAPGRGLGLPGLEQGLGERAKALLATSGLSLAPFLPQLLQYL